MIANKEKGQTTVSKEDPIVKGAKKEDDWKPTNIAEYLFSNDRGEIADDIDQAEID